MHLLTQFLLMWTFYMVRVFLSKLRNQRNIAINCSKLHLTSTRFSTNVLFLFQGPVPKATWHVVITSL